MRDTIQGATEICGGGAIGDALRAYPWEKTAVGPIAQWPLSLKAAVNIVLNSQFPMAIYAGPQFELIYNEGFLSILAGKGSSLAVPGHIVWREIWDSLGATFSDVRRTGRASWDENQFFSLERNGHPEETYFTFSASPIGLEEGQVHSVLVALMETTERVLECRRRRVLQHLSESGREARSEAAACRVAIDVLATHRQDISLVGLARRCGGAGAMEWMVASGVMCTERLAAAQEALEKQHFVHRKLVDGARICAMPIRLAPGADACCSLFLELNPLLVWNEAHRNFCEAIGDQVAIGVAYARALAGESRLDYLRVGSGTLAPKYAPTDIAALTSEVANVFRSTMEKAKVAFVIDCPKTPEPVLVDRDMWQKIVRSLLSNAFRYTPSGRVSILLGARLGEVELVVSDSGIGIAASNIPRLFDGSSGHGGSGLPLVHELVRLHHGRIEVESEVGRGSLFRVRLPSHPNRKDRFDLVRGGLVN